MCDFEFHQATFIERDGETDVLIQRFVNLVNRTHRDEVITMLMYLAKQTTNSTLRDIVSSVCVP
jgi:hypothetical protein